MRDQRADALAQILVRYSTRVEKGDVCVIQSTTTAEPLVQAVYEEVLKAGGLPVMQMTSEGAAAAFYSLASDAQLEWVCEAVHDYFRVEAQRPAALRLG